MIAVPPPVLDRRDDEQILEQLRKLAAEYVPEWKGYQDGEPDAGIMLHRIFTRLLEITLAASQQGSEQELRRLPQCRRRQPPATCAGSSASDILADLWQWSGPRASGHPSGHSAKRRAAACRL